MAWIESHQTLGRHPKVLRLAGILKINKAQAIGHLHLLWWWTLDFAPDGDLSAFTSCEIGAAAEWTGQGDGFLEALYKSKWMDEGQRLHDWHEYGGKLEAARERERLRKKKARDKQRTPKEIRQPSGGHPADETGKSPAREEDSTEQEKRELTVVPREAGNVPTPESPNGLSLSQDLKGVLRQTEGFVEAWTDWRRHLDEVGKPMGRSQEGAVLLECGRVGGVRAIDVIRYSIQKGAKNLIWDAPEVKHASARKDVGDPEGWADWLKENYPDNAFVHWAVTPESVRAEFRRERRAA